MLKIIYVILISTLSTHAVADTSMPYMIHSIECTSSNGDTTLDFRWDMSKSPFMPQIYLNGQNETDKSRLTGKEDGDFYEKPGKFAISLRPSDENTQFTKSAMILDQYVSLNCTYKEEWISNGCSELLVNQMKELRRKFKD